MVLTALDYCIIGFFILITVIIGWYAKNSMNKGIDGFRMDVISIISKRHFNDSPYESFSETVTKVYANGPRLHEFLHEMNVQVLSKYDVMTVGEGPGISLDNAAEFVGEDRAELNMIFHFDHMFIDHGEKGRFIPA